MRAIWRIGILAMLATLCACGGSNPQPLSSEEFYSRHTINESSQSRSDHPGMLPSPESNLEPSAPPSPQPAAPAGGLSPTVEQAFPAPADISVSSTQPSTQPSLFATTRAATEPTTIAAPAPVPGEYMILGTVVANVNGVPIYSNKVLERDAPVLRQLARDYDIDRFRIAARTRIDATTNELIQDELQYAAAEQTLDKDDKQLAQALTSKWREREITLAGGSLEVARRRASTDGEDFNERVNDQHRYYMVMLFLMRKVEPRVQVTAADMRRYYQAHLKTDYSKPDKATVLIIHTDPSDLGEELAKSKIEDMRRRALAGEDFAALAKLQSSSIFTEPREIERDSFALTKVESAIWLLNAGDVSPVIEDRGGYYIVKLLSIEKGGVKPFNDEAVQDRIRQILRAQQMQRLQQEEMIRLKQNAAVNYDPSMIDPAVDMAMQNYPEWSKK